MDVQKDVFSSREQQVVRVLCQLLMLRLEKDGLSKNERRAVERMLDGARWTAGRLEKLDGTLC